VNLAGHDAHYLAVVWAVACALGVAAILGMAVLFRRARKAAETEEVDRILADHDIQEGGNRRDSHVSSRHGDDRAAD
jgi:beta-lactamase regulating signal transducer with metallopeptidase domain